MPLGQLQNQAYGYLFPQGAFFAGWHWLVGLLPTSVTDVWNVNWVGQALWWSLTLIIAFTGLYRVAEAAGIGTFPSRVLAALLYALSPRIITTVGAISSESWPFALAPWIALPIMRVVWVDRNVTKQKTVLAVCLSATAIVAAGAVNAVSTAAACVPTAIVLVGAGLFGPHRRRAWLMFAGWLAACVIVSVWWLVPLLLLGKFSPPFTDYIESSGVTTRWLNLAETLRGTTSWTPFVSTERVGGHALVAEPILIFATVAIAGIGLLGLSMRHMPMRRTLWVMVLAGLVIMASWTEPFGLMWQQGRSLLDGAAAAIRNLHKFDAVVRLPLLLGFAHAVAQLPLVPWTRRNRQMWLHPEKHLAGVAAMAVIVAAVGALSPAWSARLAPDGGFERVPAYWHKTAQWLNTHAADSRTLILPSSPFALQDWGNTRDEPLQPLIDVPWVVRDAVPLVPPEAIRGVDGIRDYFTRGEGSPALAATLNNNGIGYVVVRSDLAAAYRTDDIRTVRSTIERSPQMTKVAEFFDEDASPSGERVRDSSRAVVQIWRAGSATDADSALRPRLIDATDIPLVSGGPEVLARLDRSDHDAPVRILAGSNAGTVTDTPARRGRNYGEITRATSAILSVDEDPMVRNAVPDYPVEGIAMTTTGTGRGTLEASSSASEPYNVGGAASEHSLNSLVDGDPTTWWQPATGTGQAQWVEAHFEREYNDVVVTLTGAVVPVEVQIKSATATTNKVLMPGKATAIAVPGGATDRVRVTATSAPVGFTLAEMRITSRGTDITPIREPVVPDSSPVVQRWSFGQETREGTMTRLFTVPADTTVRVAADTCQLKINESWTTLEKVGGGAIGVGDLACGETYQLSPGMYRLQSKADWVTLTSEAFRAPTRAQQHIEPLAGDTVSPSGAQRILYRPVSVNKGMVATVGGTKLSPVPVNGWQQGWVVPAGLGGAVTISYEPAATWRAGIIIGGILAAVFVLATMVLAITWRRALSADTADVDSTALPDPVPAWFIVASAAVTATLTSGFAGLATAVATYGALKLVQWRMPHWRVGETLRHKAQFHHIAIVVLAILTATSGVYLGTHPWPRADYAGTSWFLQLLAVAALSVTTLAICAPNSCSTSDAQVPRQVRTTPQPSESTTQQ